MPPYWENFKIANSSSENEMRLRICKYIVTNESIMIIKITKSNLHGLRHLRFFIT